MAFLTDLWHVVDPWTLFFVDVHKVAHRFRTVRPSLKFRLGGFQQAKSTRRLSRFLTRARHTFIVRAVPISEHVSTDVTIAHVVLTVADVVVLLHTSLCHAEATGDVVLRADPRGALFRRPTLRRGRLREVTELTSALTDAVRRHALIIGAPLVVLLIQTRRAVAVRAFAINLWRRRRTRRRRWARRRRYRTRRWRARRRWRWTWRARRRRHA
ncbi:hypothetical protein BE221DRAFT_58208, partial [Ostreococcus tauri]